MSQPFVVAIYESDAAADADGVDPWKPALATVYYHWSGTTLDAAEAMASFVPGFTRFLGRGEDPVTALLKSLLAVTRTTTAGVTYHGGVAGDEVTAVRHLVGPSLDFDQRRTDRSMGILSVSDDGRKQTWELALATARLTLRDGVPVSDMWGTLDREGPSSPQHGQGPSIDVTAITPDDWPTYVDAARTGETREPARMTIDGSDFDMMDL